MKTIRLINMTISNFKGIKSFNNDFSQRTIISGANATGKTSLWDAFTWCLFGKNSDDKTTFNIRPLTANNELEHRIDIDVAITLFISDNNLPMGEEITLRRVQKEKWVTRRGSAEEEYTGNETVYFWNDVPLSQGEYDLKVADILGNIQLFKLITNPLYFNQMKWQDRRSILVNMTGKVPVPERFADLIEKLGSKTIDEYRKEIGAKKKRIKSELDNIPARIDEVKRSRPEKKDWQLIEVEIAEIGEKIQATIDELTNSGKAYDLHNNKVIEYKKEINGLKQLISEIEYQGSNLFHKELSEKRDNLKRIEEAQKILSIEIMYNQGITKDITKKIEENEKKMEDLRKEFYDVNSEHFSFDESQSYCPTCKQILPQDQLTALSEKLSENWKTEKNRKLDEIRNHGTNLKRKNENNLARIEEIHLQNNSKLKTLEEEKKVWESKEIRSVASILEGNQKYYEAKAKLETLESNPVQEVPADRNITELKLRQSGYNDRINNLKAMLAMRDQIKVSEDRETELLRQEKELAQSLADLEKTEFQIADYIKSQVDAVEEKVNKTFSGVRFKMFSEQINGGIVETCETLVNGVPWQDANNAAKINSGMQIIDTLTKHYGVSSPVWIDNSESVNDIYQPEQAQLICLYVTNDKELKIENL